MTTLLALLLLTGNQKIPDDSEQPTCDERLARISVKSGVIHRSVHTIHVASI